MEDIDLNMRMESGLGFLFFSSDFSTGVGDLDADLLGSLDDFSSLLGADVVGDFGTESSIIHEENVEIFNIVDEEFLETVGKMESSLLV